MTGNDSMKVAFTISFLCLLAPARAAFQGLCGSGSKAGKEECLKGSNCPPGRNLVGQQYTLCYDTETEAGGVCCEMASEMRQQDPNCGIVTSVTGKIGFGQDASICSAPWQVSIRTRDDKTRPIALDNSLHWCGGTLISNQHILTTPLCLFSAGVTRATDNIRDDVMIVAGDWDHTKIDFYNGELSEQYFRVDNWELHPNYPNVTSLNDINVIFHEKGEPGFHANGFVIIKLNQPIQYTSCVRPACLTNEINDISSSPCGIDNCKMTGWGNSENGDLRDFLQQATLQMPNVETCAAIEYYGANLESLPANTTCAISPARPRAFHCVGDQGGPVVCKGSDGRWTLRGSVLARLLCDSGKPVPVADVTQVMDWVNETIQIL